MEFLIEKQKKIMADWVGNKISYGEALSQLYHAGLSVEQAAMRLEK